MDKIKKIIKFILAENEDFTLEQRLFISALIIGILMGIIGTVTNFILLDSLIAILVPSFMAFILICFYYFVRIKLLFKPLSLPIIICAYFGLSVIWYHNGGMDGSNDIIFIVSFILGLIIVEKKKKVFILFFFIAIKSSLYFVQLYRPELIGSFPSEKARWLDVFSTSLYTTFLIYLIINFLHRNYTQERFKVEQSKKELIDLNIKLKESNDTKDMIFSIISHDLKSPFNSIIGFSDLLVNNLEKYDKTNIHTLATNINNAANETYLLLENLLKWASLQKGLLTPEYKKFNLLKIVDETCHLYLEIAKNKSIAININILDTIHINADLEITKTILRNLIANAIKFTDTNGNIFLSAIENDKEVEIKISDDGVGIAKERIPELFTIQKNNTTRGTANEKGTGLGLHLCKALIEKQGGTIEITSETGKGSTFSFTVAKFSVGEKVDLYL